MTKRSNFRIAVLAGDGIGTEVVAEAEKVLEIVGQCLRWRLAKLCGLAATTSGRP